MEVHRRNVEAFWSNRLKKNQLAEERFTHLQRAELAIRLDRLADVRRSTVTRGKILVANPTYPDKPTIEKVSRLLAKKLYA